MRRALALALTVAISATGLYFAGVNLVLRSQLEAIDEGSDFRLDYELAYAVLPGRVTIQDITISRADASGSLSFERARLRIDIRQRADCSVAVRRWDGRGLTVEWISASARLGKLSPDRFALIAVSAAPPRPTLCIEEFGSDLNGILTQDASLRGRLEVRAERIRISERSFTADRAELAIREGQFDAGWGDALMVQEPVRASLSASGVDWSHGMLRASLAQLVAETLTLDLNGYGTARFHDVQVENLAMSSSRGTAAGAVRARISGASSLLSWTGLPDLSLYLPELDDAPLTLETEVERSPEGLRFERVSFEVAGIHGRGAWRIRSGEGEGALIVRRGGASMGFAVQAKRSVHELNPDERWLRDTLEQLNLR